MSQKEKEPRQRKKWFSSVPLLDSSWRVSDTKKVPAVKVNEDRLNLYATRSSMTCSVVLPTSETKVMHIETW